jgi:hypothetical protein
VTETETLDNDGRNETEVERLDRNWTEILQELRVTQTGTQILTGFLLTLAFQQRFTDLDAFQVDAYLVLVGLATLATTLALAPVSVHRALFRKNAKARVVRLANRILKATLVVVAIVLAGTVLLIFDVVLDRTAGIVAGTVAIVVIGLAWLTLPVFARARPGE